MNSTMHLAALAAILAGLATVPLGMLVGYTIRHCRENRHDDQ